MGNDDWDSWMRPQVIRLRFRRELINITQDGINVVLQSLMRVLEVLLMEITLGGFVASFACHIKIISRVAVVVLQYFQEENIPNFRRNVSSLRFNQQVFKVISKCFDLRFKLHGFTEDCSAVIRQESIFCKNRRGIGRAAQGDCEGGASRNISNGIHIAITVGIKRNFNIGLTTMIELDLLIKRKNVHK